jgi:hypothetical protein
MEMLQRVDDDPEYRSAAAECAALHAQREVLLKHREDLRLILTHTQNPHVPVPAALALMDVRDARREAAAVDRTIEDLERAIATQRRAVEQAASEASEKILTEERPAYRALVAAVDRARQSLVAAEAARMAFLRDLERRGVRTGGLTAEG